jgi:energy-converting hydrogenase Eha subunit C
MKTNIKNELIAFAIITCILIGMVLLLKPIDKIIINDFGGIFGVIGFIVVKYFVDAYFAKK